MSSKQWFILINKQKKGPFSIDELRHERIDDSVMVWRQGMSEWAYAKNVEETKTLFSKSRPDNTGGTHGGTPTNFDLSALIEVKPDETDDRTSAIDPTRLKHAKIEAAKIHRQVERFSKSNLLKYLGLAIVATAIYTLSKSGFAPAKFLAEAQNALSQLTSPFPELPDVSKEDYERLRLAAQTSLPKHGPKIKWAQSQTNPVFYLATNMPEGTALSLSLYGKPGNVMSERSIEIRVPVAVAKRLGKTPPLHTQAGAPLPPGEYDLYVTEDDEQPTEAAKILDALPANNKTPEFLRTLGKRKKLLIMDRVLVGDINKPEFRDRLQKMRSSLKSKGTEELKKLLHGVEIELSFLNSISDVSALLSQSNPKTLKKDRRDAKKKWEALARQTTLTDPTLLESGYIYKGLFDNLQQLKKQLQSYRDSLKKQFQSKIEESALNDLVRDKIPATKLKLAELKNKVESHSRQYADPEFVPSLNSL